MHAGAGRIEVASDERSARRNGIAHLFFKVVGYIRDDGYVHTVGGTAQGSVLYNHGFQGAVTRAFAYAQKGAVDGGAAVKPCCGGVGDHLVKVVVSVPFELGAGHLGVILQTRDYAGHGARQSNAGVTYTVTESVAGADFYGNTRFARKFHKFDGERHHKAVEVGAGDVLEMAARHDALGQRVLYDAQILVCRLTAGKVHFFENVVIRTAYQNTRFPYTH